MPRQKRGGQIKGIWISHPLIKKHGAAWLFPNGTVRDVYRLFGFKKKPTRRREAQREERFASSLLLRGAGMGTRSSVPSFPGAAVACHGFLRLGENAWGFGGSFVKGELSPSFPE